MVLTLKKIQHRDAGRIGLFFSYSAGAHHNRGSAHNLRHLFAPHLIEAGTDIRYIQQLLGHSSIKTTMIYAPASNKAINQIQSPSYRLTLEIENKSDEKKYNNFGGLTS